MELKNVQVLITGGSDGIGKGLAQRLLAAGCKVIVTGRDARKLRQARQELPGLMTFQNDIAQPEQRELLAKKATELLPQLGILINNAGIQRRTGLAADQAPWAERQTEIDILVAGPIHLNHLLIPVLIQRESLIVNVTSGGAYVPQAFAPIYSACKAALHSYTLTLRHSLSQTSCRVAELIPPAVQTALAGPSQQHGVPLNEFCDAVYRQLFEADCPAAGFGPTANIGITVNGIDQETLFLSNAGRFPVSLY